MALAADGPGVFPVTFFHLGMFFQKSIMMHAVAGGRAREIVYREEYYLQNKEPKPNTEEHGKWQIEMDAAHGRAEVIIAKQRHGPTGTVPLQFEGQFTRFSDFVDDGQLPAQTY